MSSSAPRPAGASPARRSKSCRRKFKAVQKWNANRKLGQAVAFEAMDTRMKLADEYGIGAVAVDNAFHYLWGGGYVIDAAKKGYIAYTCCTAALAEVVPFGGKFPTLGTNPHSLGLPDAPMRSAIPICIDWATSTVAMGRVQQFVREGKQLPPGCAVDENGKETTDPNKVKALLPFGQHKGYGLSLIDELYAAYIGGSLPTIRNRWDKVPAGREGHLLLLLPVHPARRDERRRLRRGPQPERRTSRRSSTTSSATAMTSACSPGQIEAAGAALSQKHGGLLFTEAEVKALAEIAAEAKFKFDL